MASVQSVEKLFSCAKITSYLSGDASTAKDIAWVDMRDYEHFAAIVTAAALTGLGVTAFSIIANNDSAGGGTDATVVSHALGTAPDAAGDMVVLECSAEQIRAVRTDATGDLRYLSVKLTCANAADNIVVTYIRHMPRFHTSGLTADVIS